MRPPGQAAWALAQGVEHRGHGVVRKHDVDADVRRVTDHPVALGEERVPGASAL